jgi:hypothetical protein
MTDEWASYSRDGVRKSPGFDAAMRKVSEDMAAREAANPVPAEERLRRTLDAVPRDLAAAREMIACFFRGRWRR